MQPRFLFPKKLSQQRIADKEKEDRLIMSLTRKMLKEIGIDDDKIDQIIEAHAETVSVLKSKVADGEAVSEELETANKKIADLEAAAKTGNYEYKEKYEIEHAAFEKYKGEQTEKEIKAAKNSAAKSYFKSKNIDEKYMNIAIKAASKEIDALELDNGEIKDTSSLDALINSDYSSFVQSKVTVGANTANPPTSTERKYEPRNLREALEQKFNGKEN